MANSWLRAKQGDSLLCIRGEGCISPDWCRRHSRCWVSDYQVAATRSEVTEAARCQACGGDGWYVGHEDACYDTGDCSCSGVQIQCDSCDGTGLNRG